MGVEKYPKKPLESLLSIHDSRRIPVKKSDRKPGQYPYYGASGIVDWVDSYIFDGSYLLLAEDGENLRTKSTPIAFIAHGKFWVNNHAHVLQGGDDLDTRFFCYALQVADVDSYISGSTRPKITQGDMKRIPLYAPEQRLRHSVARILGSIDEKIELNRKMNQTLEQMAQALFKSWFIDFDPVVYNAVQAGHPIPERFQAAAARYRDNPGLMKLPRHILDLFPDRFEDSELGPVPVGWSVSAIGDAVHCVGGGTPSTKNPDFWEGGAHPFLTPKDMSSLEAPVIFETARYLTKAGVEKVSSKQIPSGAVMMSSRAPIGYLGINRVPVSVNQGVIAMICDSVLPNYYVLLWAQNNMDSIKGKAGGTTFAEISKKNFRTIPVIVPSERVLTVFSEQVSSFFGKISENVMSCQALSEMRDTLLPKLISGELRIPDAEKVAAEAV